MDADGFVQSDWILLGASFALFVLGVFVLGRGNRGGPLGLNIWSWNAFGTFAIFTGIGISFAWMAVNIEDGYLWEDLSTEVMNIIGVVAGVTLTVALLAASQFSEDGPVPDWGKALFGVLAFGLLFASALTISVTTLYNTSFEGEFLFLTMPLFPMDAYIATIWAAVLLGLAGGALKALVGDVRSTTQ
tara:strand:- start:2264 stop:2827 length:564 start_codon:yes stop_codon:yes gene_type:complete